MGRVIEAVLFDKDGTLVDFGGTWNSAVGHALGLVDDEVARQQAADILGYNLSSGVVDPGSSFVTETLDETIDRLSRIIDARQFANDMNQAAASSVEAADGADKLLDDLKLRGVAMGVVTNDSQSSAEDQVNKLGWSEYFTVVIGYDSGHKPKPHGDAVAAAAKACGCSTSRAMMVGDSQHDITAAQRAGTTGVLISDNPSWATGYDYHIASLSQLTGLPGIRLGG